MKYFVFKEKFALEKQLCSVFKHFFNDQSNEGSQYSV